MSGLSADIRGLKYTGETEDVEVRVVGVISGQRAASPAYRVARGEQPPAIGHQIDHTMKYDLSGLNAEPWAAIKKMVREASPYAAQAWAGVVPSLLSCRGHCPLNDDGGVITVDVDWGCVRLACYNPIGSDVEDKLVNGRILFKPDIYGQHTWTNIRSDDQDIAPGGGAFVWVGSYAVHEFGHAYGVADRYPGEIHYDPNYSGIMHTIQKGVRTLTGDDRDALRAIYATHTRNHGW